MQICFLIELDKYFSDCVFSPFHIGERIWAVLRITYIESSPQHKKTWCEVNSSSLLCNSKRGRARIYCCVAEDRREHLRVNACDVEYTQKAVCLLIRTASLHRRALTNIHSRHDYTKHASAMISHCLNQQSTCYPIKAARLTVFRVFRLITISLCTEATERTPQI